MKISRFQLRFRDFKRQEMIDNYCEYAILIAIIDTIELASAMIDQLELMVIIDIL